MSSSIPWALALLQKYVSHACKLNVCLHQTITCKKLIWKTFKHLNVAHWWTYTVMPIPFIKLHEANGEGKKRTQENHMSRVSMKDHKHYLLIRLEADLSVLKGNDNIKIEWSSRFFFWKKKTDEQKTTGSICNKTNKSQWVCGKFMIRIIDSVPKLAIKYIKIWK